jgi:hypothetical protein
MNTLRAGIRAMVLAWAFAALPATAQMIASSPNLTVVGLQVFCQGLQPYASFTLPVLGQDLGHPGIVFVGMHDASRTQAKFLSGDSWYDWQSGLFPVYAVRSSGLGNQQFTLPLNGLLAGGGWKLYVGYGVLSDQDEARVQQGIIAVNAARAVRGGQVANVDPDHHRRTLVQTDLVRFGKYAYVNTGVENNAKVCEPQDGGG